MASQKSPSRKSQKKKAEHVVLNPLEQEELHEFKKYGREATQKKGKTFYKGRDKQIAKDKNPSQWAAYNRAPRVKQHLGRDSPLHQQLRAARTTGILSTKSLPSITRDADDEKAPLNEVALHFSFLLSRYSIHFLIKQIQLSLFVYFE